MSHENRVTRLKHLSQKAAEIFAQVGEGAVQADYGTMLESNEVFQQASELNKYIVTGKAPKVPITTKKMPDICALFGLHLSEKEKDPLLQLEPGQEKELPELITRVLRAYVLATTGSPENEPLARTRVDAILLLTLAEKKKNTISFRDESYPQPQPERFSNDTQTSIESFLLLKCQLELNFEIPGKDGEREVLWTGRSDYSYWYGSPENAETNLIVVEAKKKHSISGCGPQLVGYMALVHDARKKAGEPDASVYGIGTDGEEWKFFCIDHRSLVSWATLDWYCDKEKVMFLLDRILDKAASLGVLSSTLTRQTTVSEATGIIFQTAEEMDTEADDSGEEDN